MRAESPRDKPTFHEGPDPRPPEGDKPGQDQNENNRGSEELLSNLLGLIAQLK